MITQCLDRSWTIGQHLCLKAVPIVDLQGRKTYFMQKVSKMSFSSRKPCIYSPYSCNVADPFYLHSSLLQFRNQLANQQELSFRCKKTVLIWASFIHHKEKERYNRSVLGNLFQIMLLSIISPQMWKGVPVLKDTSLWESVITGQYLTKAALFLSFSLHRSSCFQSPTSTCRSCADHSTEHPRGL